MFPVERFGLAALAAFAFGFVLPACADEPATAAGHRVQLLAGGELSGTFAHEDRGYFNATDYQHTTLRLLRASLDLELRAGERVALLGEARSENLNTPGVYGIYVRARPIPGRSFDVQAGRIPPVFGAYPRQRYGRDNPLIGDPLAYQYLTTLRADAVPATADELLLLKGSGWLTHYSMGSRAYDAGLPLVHTLRWDTGVELRLGSEPLSWAAAVTRGTLGNPLFHDDNAGKQISTRLAWRPSMALVVGGSFARGEYLSREVYRQLPHRETARQRALGVDFEYSRGAWLVRGEAVWSSWDMPAVAAPPIDGPLTAFAAFAEARYRMLPGLTLAARIDRLGFGEIAGSRGREAWDAPVTRAELGAAYALHRHVRVKAALQHDARDGGMLRRSDTFVAGQLLVWF
jgi:hypothetical protein